MYGTYAPIYDRIGQGAWSVRMAAWTLDWLAAHNVAVHTVADFGCGTGAAARVFRANGLAVVGVDCAASMLRIAEEQVADSVTWMEADLREVTLAAPVELVVAFYDTLNYLLRLEDLAAAWRSISKALVPGGYAVVDINTAATYATEWNSKEVVVADTDQVFVLNKLHFEPLSRIGTGRIIWFVRDHAGWVRDEEVHQQRAHTDAELVEAIKDAGLTLVERRTPTDEQADTDATRMIYVAQKPKTRTED